MIILRHKFEPAKMVIIALVRVVHVRATSREISIGGLELNLFLPARRRCTPIFQERNSTLVCSVGF